MFMMAIAATIAVVVVGCDNGKVEKIDSTAYMNATEVKGESKNGAVVLRAQQGTSYSITITSEEDWAHFSSGLTTADGRMDSIDKVVYIYFDKNASGKSREANVKVTLLSL